MAGRRRLCSVRPCGESSRRSVKVYPKTLPDLAVQVDLCETHLSMHNERAARQRVESKSIQTKG